MTAPLLLAAILTALLLQAAGGIGMAVIRRGRHVARRPTVGQGRGHEETGAWAGLRPFRIAGRDIEDSGSTQCSFYLEPVDGAKLPPFQPGQFLTLALDIPGSEDRPPGSPPITWCYSLSDRPAPARYHIGVKRVPSGIASAHLHANVQVGDVLQVRATPTLLLPSIQVNIRAGRFSEAEANGVRDLKIPGKAKAAGPAVVIPAE